MFEVIAAICETIGNSFVMIAETCPAVLASSAVIMTLILVGVWCAVKNNNN